MVKTSLKQLDNSFKILESILLLKDYKSKEDILRVAQTMAKTAQSNAKYNITIKEDYVSAFNKLQDLSFEEMQEIKRIIKVSDSN